MQEANFLIGELEIEADVTVVIGNVKNAGEFIDALIARPEVLRRVKTIDVREPDEIYSDESDVDNNTQLEVKVDKDANAAQGDGISAEEAAKQESIREWEADRKVEAARSAKLCAPITRLVEVRIQHPL